MVVNSFEFESLAFLLRPSFGSFHTTSFFGDKTMRTLTFLVSSFFFCANAHSAIVYDIFIRTSLGDSGSFTVNPSEMFSGTMILRETIDGGDMSPLAASNLNFARINLASVGSDGSFSNLAGDGEGGFLIGADADTIGYSALGAVFGQPGKAPMVLGGGVSEIVLGTVDLTAPTLGSSEFVLSVGDGASPNGFLTTFAGDLRPLADASGGGIFFSGTTLTAVPEPGSASLLGLAAIVFGASGARRRRVSMRRDGAPTA